MESHPVLEFGLLDKHQTFLSSASASARTLDAMDIQDTDTVSHPFIMQSTVNSGYRRQFF
jgi:hypothetical protein